MDAEVDAALERFAADVSVVERKEALTALLAARAIGRISGDPRFDAGRSRLLKTAGDEGAPGADRLLAIAESVRAVQMVKRLQPGLTERMTPLFERPLPALHLLPDAEDRLNVARACRRMRAEWLPDYLAQAIADEDAGELGREELVNALFERATSLAHVIRLIAKAFELLAPATEKPAETIARRLTRTLVKFRDSVIRSSLESGDQMGEALCAWIRLGIGRRGIDDKKVTVDLAAEVLLTVHDLVRTRFSVATEPATFESVGYMRQVLGGGSWPDELREPLALLIADLREALVLLGRQGVTDQRLLEQLRVLTNFPERAQAIAREISASHPELEEGVRYWLEHGRTRAIREASSAASESLARDSDSHLGFALIAVRMLASSATLRPPLLSTVEVYEPSFLGAVTEHFQRVEAAIAQIEDLARKRRISLLGRVGEEVEYSPKFFEIVSGQGVQRGTVRQPAVVRLKPDGTPGEAVVKGLLE